MSREALVVGINRYPLLKDQRTRKPQHLQKPAADAEAIAQLLETYGNFRVQRFPAINIEGAWRTDPNPHPRQLPKVTDLKSAISLLFNPPSSVPDTALLFFAGHGLLEESGGIREGFLAASDSNPGRGKWGLSLNWLRQLLQTSPVRQQIIWLDCCHSGALLNFDEADPGARGRDRDRCFIAASRDFEVAYEEVGGEHGILTGALLQALNPNNSDESWTTNYSLADFINKQLATSRQRPVFHNTGGEIILTGKKERIEQATLMAGICPYKGLQSFDFNDEDPKYFYGRTALVDELLDRASSGNFLAVVGASGSGKSSVVKAGLLYQLKLGQRVSGSDRWPIEIFRPGEHPLESLAKVFAKKTIASGAAELKEWIRAIGTERVVLTVDQFEEVFTLCEDEAERQQFFECLLGALDSGSDSPTEMQERDRAPGSLCLIITMRADFFGKCAEREYAGLARQIKDNLVPVTPMNPEELEQAITQPAYQVGLEVQRELTNQILADISGPGSLPLLQYTLTELWLNRQVNRLTLTEYTRLGGVKGALRKRADEVYQSLAVDEQLAVQRIFLELTQLGEGTEDTRRQILKPDLVNEYQSAEVVDRLVNKLTEARLLITSELQGRGEGDATVTAVDVAHEALIRHWPKLQSWLSENREAIRIERRIEAGAVEWQTHGESKEYLLVGSKLSEAESYLQDYDRLGLLSYLGKEYIYKSVRRRNNEARLKTILVSAALLTFAVLGLWAKQSEQLAKRALGVAKINLTLLADNLLENDPTRALRMAQKAYNTKDARQILPEVSQILSVAYHSALEEGSFFYAASLEHDATVTAAAFSPDGSRMVTAGEDKMVKLWDAGGRNIAAWEAHAEAINSAVFSPDGRQILSAAKDGTAKLWDLEGNLLASLEGHDRDRYNNRAVYSAVFSPDGSKIITAAADGTAKLWDTKGNPLATLAGHENIVVKARFSPDGQQIITASRDKTAKLWDLEGKAIATLGEDKCFDRRDYKCGLTDAVFSPKGDGFLTASKDKTAKLWSRDGELIAVLQHSGWVNSATFDPSGDHIVTASDDETVKLWDKNGKLIDTFEGDIGEVKQAIFYTDGQTIITAFEDNSTKIWDFNGRDKFTLRGHDDPVNLVVISAKGDRIITASEDGTAKLWNIDETQPAFALFAIEHPDEADGVNSAVFSPDGLHILTATQNQTAHLWDARSGRLLQTFKHECDDWNNCAVEKAFFSPSGEYIITASQDRKTRIWNLEGKLVESWNGHPEIDAFDWSGAKFASFSPDGRQIVTASHDKTAKVWEFDGAAITEIQKYEGHESRLNSAVFSPDGKQLLTASSDRTAKLWNPTGEIVAEFKGHEGGVNSAVFSPDGTKIITASRDKTIKMWDATGKLLQTFHGHSHSVNWATFSPDGQKIISASADNTAKLWNLQGRTIASLEGHTANINFAVFSSDGFQILTASSDGQIRLWLVPEAIDAWLQKAKIYHFSDPHPKPYTLK